MKNRENKFSQKEAEGFLVKIKELKKIGNVEKTIGFIFYITGFSEEVLDLFIENHIAWSEGTMVGIMIFGSRIGTD